jgi:hypothetical protein
MERFSYPEQPYTSFERRQLLEHIALTKDEPVIGIITEPNKADIFAFAGKNQGIEESDSALLQVLQGQERITYSHHLDEYIFVLGTDEVTSYLTRRLDNWQEVEPALLGHLTTIVSLLTAAKQFDLVLPRTIDVDSSLDAVWNTALESIANYSCDRQTIVDFAYTCLGSNLAAALHTYAAQCMKKITSYADILADPLFNAYTETQIDGTRTPKKEHEVIGMILNNAEALEK